ncbi:ATP-binding protein [Salibacterium sp. K-3]
MIFRFFMGGIGAAATVLEVTVLLIFLLLLADAFPYFSRRMKVLAGSTVSLFAAVTALLIAVFLFGGTFSWSFVLLYLGLTLASTAAIIYSNEVFYEHSLMNRKVVKAEKMEMVSHLAASVSHEVRNPLTVVRGFLQMLQQEDITPEKRREFLNFSMDEIDRADGILKNYLLFARPSPEDVTVIHVKDQVEKVLQIVTPLAHMNSVKIHTTIKDVQIEGNEHDFQQCLVNIIKNGIEAMPDSGALFIEAGKEEDDVVLRIEDNGNGMTREQISRLGEPYYTTKGREGTGLGMMAAYKIIETMNGTITVTSVLQQGTTFVICFPAVDSN